MIRVIEPYHHQQPAGVAQPKRQIHVLLDNIRSAHNAGSILRTADGIGAKHIYLCGITPNPGENPALQKTALGAEAALPWSSHLDAVALAQNLRDQGFVILVLETTLASQSLFETDLTPLNNQTILLVMGNEQAGVDPGLLNLCHMALSVPMAGTKGSLNVAVAFGIAAYWLAFS